MEYKLWRAITAEHIREEVINVLGEDQIVTLTVDVKMYNQTPPLAPTMAPSSVRPLPTAAEARGASVRDIVIGDLRRDLQQDSGSTASLNLFFDVAILLRSPEESHDVGRYIGGAFNSVDDKQSYIVDLRLTQQPAFDNTISVDVQVPDAAPTPAPRTPVESSTMNVGIIIGVVAVALSGMGLAGFLLYTRRKNRRRRIQSEAEKDPPPTDVPSTSNNGRTYAGEIHMHDNDDVSNLTDPYGMGSRAGLGAEGSMAGETIENYEFWKNYRANQTIGSTSHEGSEHNILVEEDDDTLRIQYLEEDKFEVGAPAGMLGLVLEAAPDGVPIVHAIKSTSPLSDQVQVGDRLVSVDGDDVTILLASDVSRLISLKRDQHVRRFVFSRPGSGAPRAAVVEDSFDEESAPAMDITEDETGTGDEVSTLDGEVFVENEAAILFDGDDVDNESSFERH